MARLKLLLWIVAAAVLVFLFMDYRDTAIELASRARMFPLGIALALFVAGGALSARIWVSLIRALAPSANAIRTRKLFGIYCSALLAKYIPGGIWEVSGRTYLMRREGVDISATLASIGYALLLSILAGLLLPAIIFPRLLPGIADSIPGFAAFAVIVVVIAALVVFFRPGFLLRAAHVPGHFFLPRRSMLWGIAQYAGSLVLFGLGYGLFLFGIYGALPASWPVLIGSFSLALTVGVLVVPAPAGIGVRDIILFFFLQQTLPPGEAALIAAGARLISTLAEVLLFFFGRALSRTSPNMVQKTMTHEDIKRLAELPFPTNSELNRVDIIVLKYRDEEAEARCIQYVIERTTWPYVLTLFDNRPGTKNIAKAWNKLIKESTCDYVLLLNTDAFVPQLDPCWLTRMMGVFIAKPGSVAVLPKVDRTSCGQQRAGKPYNGEPELLSEPFAAQCVLFKKEIFDDIGFFDEDFLLHGQDTELAMRLLSSPHQAYVVPDVLVRHIGHHSIKRAVAAGEIDKVAEDEYTKKIYEEKTKRYKTTS